MNGAGADFGRIRAQCAPIWDTFDPIGPMKPGAVGPTSIDVGPKSANFDRSRPALTGFGPGSNNLGPKSTKLSMISAGVGRNWFGNSQSWPGLFEFWLEIHQTSAKSGRPFGRIWANGGGGRMPILERLLGNVAYLGTLRTFGLVFLSLVKRGSSALTRPSRVCSCAWARFYSGGDQWHLGGAPALGASLRLGAQVGPARARARGGDVRFNFACSGTHAHRPCCRQGRARMCRHSMAQLASPRAAAHLFVL